MKRDRKIGTDRQTDRQKERGRERTKHIAILWERNDSILDSRNTKGTREDDDDQVVLIFFFLLLEWATMTSAQTRLDAARPSVARCCLVLGDLWVG